MQRASRLYLTCEHSSKNRPQITVKPGEVFEAETELCSGNWLKDLESRWPAEKICGSNPAVVVAAEGAVPGDFIRVHIHSIIPDTIGYTGFLNRDHELANRIIDRDWGYNIRNVRIEDGYVHFSPSLKLPVKPMIGTLGTAPAGDAVSNSRGGRHGGNMDTQEVCAGAVITLPVEVPGALLHIGDVHAIQGDGEINSAGGIECRALVTMHVEITAPPAHSECVRVENKDEICAIACEGDLENCCVTAVRELIYWICEDYRMDERDAYLLLGQIMEMRIPQLVNPTHTIIAKAGKSFLPQKK